MGYNAASRIRRAAVVGASLAALVCLAYGPAQLLPFISDDYLHIRLAREYGSPGEWAHLFADPLYRCRAVSILHAWLLDSWFGPVPLVFNLSSLALHWMNCLLIAAFGSWRLIGWRVSVPAAAFFAVFEYPQEAVVWFAASPELHVFGFLAAAILCWIHRRPVLCLACFVLALLSKESGAILPALLALISVAERDFQPRRWAIILALTGLAAAYFAAGYINRTGHLHYNDGTFSLHAPFWITLPHSIARMSWLWGLAAAALIRDWRPVVLALGWMTISLLPYSFLTYMTRVPSRHTYIAAAGLALLAGRAALQLWNDRRPAMAIAAVAIVLGNSGYLWTRKQQQYLRRAEPTEELVRQLADDEGGPVLVCNFPYHRSIAESVALVSGSHPDRLTFCDTADR